MVDATPDIGNNTILKFLKRRMRVTDGPRSNTFTMVETDPATQRKVRFATPLLLALVLIEFVDLLFAVDSVPAIFAITTNPMASSACWSRWRIRSRPIPGWWPWSRQPGSPRATNCRARPSRNTLPAQSGTACGTGRRPVSRYRPGLATTPTGACCGCWPMGRCRSLRTSSRSGGARGQPAPDHPRSALVVLAHKYVV